MTSRIMRLTGALTALVLCAALAACGGGGGSSTEAAYGTAGDGASGGADSRVTVGAVQGIPQLDPYKLVAPMETSLMHTLWASLVKHDEQGEIVGELAESWEVSDDQRTYTFKLVPDATFADGKAIDAEVVVANLKRAKDDETAWVMASYLPDMKRVEAVDATTVRIELRRPARSLLGALSLAMIADPANLKAINKTPNSSGPFTLGSFTPNERVVLERRDDYWGTPARTATLELTRARDSTAAVTALRTGDLDVLFQVPWTDAESLGKDGIDVLVSDRPGDASILMVDNTSEPFDDPRARRALSLATNREAMVETAYAGKTEVASANVPMSRTNPAFDQSLPPATFDIEQARKLFAEVGVKKLTWFQPSEGYPEFDVMAQIFRDDMKKAGVDVQIESVELNSWYAKFAPAGKRWPGTVIPTVYVAPHEPSIFLAQWFPGICECNFDDPAYVEAVEQGAAAPDDAKANAAFGRAQQIFAEQSPVSVVTMMSFPVAVRKGVTGVFLGETGYGRFEQVSSGG